MKSWLKLCWSGLHYCGTCAVAFAVWTLWLVLALLLVLQVWVATSRELPVPDFALRSFEARLAVSHVRVNFGRATFDPAGRILIEHVQLSLPAFSEPLVTSRATYIELDPWALLAGKFEPRLLRATGVNLLVPAMFSSSGQTEQILRDLEITVTPDGHEVLIPQLTGRVAGIAVTARGALHYAPSPGGKVAPLPIADYLASHYPDLCRRLVRLSQKLSVLDQPRLEIELTPSETRGAIADVTVFARSVKVPGAYPIEVYGLRADTRVPMLGDDAVMAPLELSCDDLKLPGATSARAVHAWVRGSLKPALFSYEPRTAELAAARLESHGFALTDVSVQLEPGALPRLGGGLLARCADEPVAVRAQADLKRQSATLRFDGTLAPALLDPISLLIHHEVRRFLDFGAPVQLGANVTFAKGWKFTGLEGRVALQQITAHRVPLDYASGHIEFDGRHFIARDAFARQGENFARGSFEQDLATREFRFLLEGQLRPLDISGWFREWWPDFFQHFEFPAAPPQASVDVAGHWFEGWRTTVFVFAEAREPVVSSVKFDYARTRLFIRPNFCDTLELFGTQGTGTVRGTFTRQVGVPSYALHTLDFDVTSSIDPTEGARIFGPAGLEIVAPFHFSVPPALKLNGHISGADSSAGAHELVHIEGQSGSAFTFHDFPLNGLSFTAVQRDDVLSLDRVQAGFADGAVSGKARIWGHAPDRRLGFDYALKGARLSEAITTLDQFNAKRHGRPALPPDKFVQAKANVKLDLAASAEGRFDDPFSFQGEGNAVLAGAELGEVKLLGLLSELLNFTSLRFTSARSSFKIDGPRLTFPDVSITGANSAITAHGSYALDRSELNFNARVFPFQESKFILSNVVGAVLSPLSNFLEVKLTGSLEKPKWAFVIGPTNFLRSLIQSSPASPPSKEGASPYLKR